MAKVPKNISKQDILQALVEIDEKGIPSKARSSTYDIVHDGKRYPPKYVVSIANKFANGEELDRSTFHGGLNQDACKLLERNGFTIDTKKDQFDTAYKKLRKQFLEEFPDFKGFKDDGRYIAKERGYKDDLIKIFQRDIRPLLESKDWALAGDALRNLWTRKLPTTSKSQNIVGWRYIYRMKKLSDLELAHFASEVAQLTDESLSLEQRTEQILVFFSQLPEKKQLPAAATRIIISFYLALNDPHHYLFLKTQEIARIAKRFDPKFSWSTQNIQAQEIEYINELAHRIFERLDEEGWSPQDLIDVQSFLWIAENAGNQNKDDWVADSTGNQNKDDSESKTTYEHTREVNLNRVAAKNQILYGPPGTGKTYHTVNKALEILDPEFYEANKSDRSTLKRRFDEFKAKGQIDFVTFHQSFSYEDFVEGLRASTDENGQIHYEVEDGIFKRMCNAAAENIQIESNQSVDVTGRRIWKQRFLGKSSPAQSAHQRPFKEGEIIKGKYFVEKVSPELLEVGKPNGKVALLAWSMIDELVELIDSGKLKIENIGKPEIFKDIDTKIDPFLVNGYWNFLPAIITKSLEKNLKNISVQSAPPDAWVLIIDEINRGNIANILGELITLIEPSKRAGAEESLEVALPYSKKKFSVPANLYIIGTMNTADRSLVHIDTALRRRFQFEVMLPDIGVLDELGIQDVEGVDVQKMLRTLNSRIELLYDKEHTLGHSFFVPLQDHPNLVTLRRIFENQIMPLLEEYFFEDWSRIQQILGDDHKSDDDLKFYVPAYEPSEIESLLGGENNQILHDKTFKRNEKALHRVEAFLGIYEQPVVSG